MADDKPYTRRKHSREKGKTNSDKCSFVKFYAILFSVFPLANSTAENVAQRSKSCKQGVVQCDAESLLACPLNFIFSFVTHLSWLQTRRNELSFVQKNYLGFKTSWEPREETLCPDVHICTCMMIYFAVRQCIQRYM